MRVFVPSPLHSYTGGRGEVQTKGSTLEEVLQDLDIQFPGIRFRMLDEQNRIRPHMRIFINQKPAADIRQRLSLNDEIEILQALSGG